MDEFLRGFHEDSLYFQRNNELFQQINGLPMGLSVSPIIADIVIQDLKEEFLARYKSILFLVEI